MTTITQTTLRESFKQEVQNEIRVLRAKQEHVLNDKLRSRDYMVYSYAAISVLIDKMRKIEADFFDEPNTRYRARYVVGDNGAMWFALEGRPGRGVPAHSDMSQHPCVAAGIVEFSTDYSSIKLISNESGHFEPGIGTLVRALAALQNLNAVLAENVTIKCINGNVIYDIELNCADTYQLLPDNFHINSNQEYSIGVYSADQWCFYNKEQTPIIKTNVTETYLLSVINNDNEQKYIAADDFFDDGEDVITTSTPFNNLLPSALLNDEPVVNNASFFNANSPKRTCIRNNDNDRQINTPPARSVFTNFSCYTPS